MTVKPFAMPTHGDVLSAFWKADLVLQLGPRFLVGSLDLAELNALECPQFTLKLLVWFETWHQDTLVHNGILFMTTGAKQFAHPRTKNLDNGSICAPSIDTRPTSMKDKPLLWRTSGSPLQNKK